MRHGFGAALLWATGFFYGANYAFGMEVTVYNQDLGLIQEHRRFSLKEGANDIRVDDVAAQIDPTSVHIKSIPAAGVIDVLEQDFEYDLISQDKLLKKYIGKEIELERMVGSAGDKKEVIRGTLLSSDGGLILQSGGRIYVNPSGNPVLPELPEGLLTKPTLLWQVLAKRGGSQDFEFSYLTQGMGWQSDYVLLLGPKDDSMDLNAWVTINNHSGAVYKDAKLKLVAGDVHRAPEPIVRRAMLKAMSSASAMDQMSERPFFEYHLYQLERPTTLRDNETKQIEMASAQDVPVKKSMIYDGAEGMAFGEYTDYSRSDPSYGLGNQKKVWVMLEFNNSRESHLGLPLPAGRIRVYKKEADGSSGFVGEDRIDHTPKDEKIRVRMGNAFDVVGERSRTNFLSDTHHHWFQETFEIKVRNHKEEDVTVTVIEHLYRWNQWKILDASQKWNKKDAQTIEFQVPVKKNGEAVVTYTVNYSW